MANDGELSSHFKTGQVKNWPSVPNSDDYGDEESDLGSLDLENNEFVFLDGGKLILVTGGDWQDAWCVEIINSSGGLKVKNYERADNKGRYKNLTKKKNRMSYDEITKVMFSDHQMNKSLDEFVKEVKSSFKEFSPYDFSYGDEQYENKVIEGPKFDKENFELYVIWNVGGFDSNANKESNLNDIYKTVETEEDYVLKKFKDWIKKKFWFGKKGEYEIKNKTYNIKCNMKSIGDDNVKFSIKIKEKGSKDKIKECHFVIDKMKDILNESKKKKKPKKRNTFKKLQDNKVALSKEERAEVMKKKAVWHFNGDKPSPAVWKSKDPKTEKITYITHTRRTYNTAPTLKGATGRFHDFIKGTS